MMDTIFEVPSSQPSQQVASELVDDSRTEIDSTTRSDDIIKYNEMIEKLAEPALSAAEPEQAGRIPVAGQEASVKLLQEALDAGDVKSRTPAFSKFMSSLSDDPELKKDYEKLKGVKGSTQLKKEFRVRWAERTFMQKTVMRKTKKKQYSTRSLLTRACT